MARPATPTEAADSLVTPVSGDVPTLARSSSKRAPSSRSVWRIVRWSGQAVTIFTASRVGLLLVAVGLAHLQHKTVQSYLTRWDSVWYLAVARSGYPHVIKPGVGTPAQSTLGFFPLLPLIIRLAAHATGLSDARAGLVVTFLAGLIAAVLVWWLLYPVWGRTGAGQGTALVFFSPGAFVLSEVYTEGLLIALVAGALLALRERRWLTAGVLSGLATATEPLGMAVILPCAVAALYAIRERRDWRSLLAPVLAPAGVVGFFCFLWVRTGTPFAWFITQRRGWQGGDMGGGIYHEILGFAQTGLAHPDYAVKLVSGLVCVVLLAFLLWPPRDVAVFAYVLGVLFLALLSPITGFSWRVLLCAFPLLAIAGARIRGGWFLAVLGASALAMAAVAFVSMGSNSLTP
jgi:hypothetical protein